MHQVGRPPCLHPQRRRQRGRLGRGRAGRLHRLPRHLHRGRLRQRRQQRRRLRLRLHLDRRHLRRLHQLERRRAERLERLHRWRRQLRPRDRRRRRRGLHQDARRQAVERRQLRRQFALLLRHPHGALQHPALRPGQLHLQHRRRPEEHRGGRDGLPARRRPPRLHPRRRHQRGPYGARRRQRLDRLPRHVPRGRLHRRRQQRRRPLLQLRLDRRLHGGLHQLGGRRAERLGRQLPELRRRYRRQRCVPCPFPICLPATPPLPAPRHAPAPSR